VYDSKNQRVTQEAALTSPERIGAIYFQSRSASNTSYCGSFSQGAVAFREFVLGNIGMVQSWSLATPEITSRLSSDIETLTAFQAELPCLAVPEQASWSAGLACDFSNPYFEPAGSLQNYDFALGIPSELYWPSADNLSALIAALRVSLPQGDPLQVNPGG
jgi:hypothetical protein